VSTAAPPMTLEQMLALPEDGVERELVRGELREKPMTRRNYRHSTVESLVVWALIDWWKAQPEPRGVVASGEAGFRLHRNPDTGVGIDVAYVSPEVVALTQDVAYFEGPPVLAVEILSPSDMQAGVDEKVELYLGSGVSLVWVINPRFRTVTVHRPGAEPELFNVTHELTAEPHLAGFRVPVAHLFPS